MSMQSNDLPKNLRSLLLAVQYAGQNTTPSLANEVREAAMRAAAAKKAAAAAADAAKKEKADAAKKASEANKRKQDELSNNNQSGSDKRPTRNTASTGKPTNLRDHNESDSDSSDEFPNPSPADPPLSTGEHVPPPPPNAPPAFPTHVPNLRSLVQDVTYSDSIAIETVTSAEDNPPVNVASSPQPKPTQDDATKPFIGASDMLPNGKWEQATQVPPPCGGHMFHPCNAHGGGQSPFFYHTQAAQPPPWGSMPPGAHWSTQLNVPPSFCLGMAPPQWANHVQPHSLQWGAAQPPSQMNVNVLPPTPPRVREAAMIARMKCEVDTMKANLVEAEYKYMHR